MSGLIRGGIIVPVDETLRDRTIHDFGEQWTRFTDNEGYYGSTALLDDLFGSLVDLNDLRGARVADIGAGTGRFVNILLDKGVAHVIAVEPSAAMNALRQNTAARQQQITYVHGPGEQLPPDADLDFVFSIGVLHHIPDPAPVVAAARRSLRRDGRLLIWLYGREGNGLYLMFVNPVRRLVKSGPHWLLNGLTWVLWPPVAAYIQASRWLPLPLREYARGVLGKFSSSKVRLVIYDQLNPAYAKYYRRDEAVKLLSDAGFDDITTHHRHGYSWSVSGIRRR